MILLGTALYLIFPRPLECWGRRGHQLVNGAAVENLPEPLRAYLRIRKIYLMGHASDPDELAQQNEAERPHHFTDAEAYEPYPFSKLREQFVTHGRGPTARQAREGDSIWQIDFYFRRLTDDWRGKRWNDADRDMIFVAHYAADLTQPLHTVVNFDGQHTRQAGIHARFESELVNVLADRWTLHPAPARIETNVRARIFDEFLASYRARLGVFAADSNSARRRGYVDPAYAADFQKSAGPIAQQRLEAAVSFVSSLWYTAWVRAGKPRLGGSENSR